MDAPKLKNDDLSEDVDGIDAKLSRALDFGYRDLLENRDGYLSKNQRESLRRHTWRKTWGPIIAGLCFAGFFFLAAATSGRGCGSLIVVPLVFLLIGLGWIAPAVEQWYKVEADLRRGTVVTARGWIVLDIKPGTRSEVTCTLFLEGGLLFSITRLC